MHCPSGVRYWKLKVALLFEVFCHLNLRRSIRRRRRSPVKKQEWWHGYDPHILLPIFNTVEIIMPINYPMTLIDTLSRHITPPQGHFFEDSKDFQKHCLMMNYGANFCEILCVTARKFHRLGIFPLRNTLTRHRPCRSATAVQNFTKRPATRFRLAGL